MKDNCQTFNTQKIKVMNMKILKVLIKPNFYLFNFLLIVANLIGISYLQLHESKLFSKNHKKRI